MTIQLTPIATFTHGTFDEGAAEIVAFDPTTDRLYVINGELARVDILDIGDPSSPTLVGTLDVADDVGGDFGGINSIDVDDDGFVAVAVSNADPTANGFVVGYDPDGNVEAILEVGVGPDSLAYSRNNALIIVANEGEATDDADPDGSLSVIELDDDGEPVVATIDFSQFNGQEDALREQGILIPEGQTAAQAFEPEFVTISPDETQAIVTLQENNAILTIDLDENLTVLGLGFQDFSTLDTALDPSNEDGGINVSTAPVFGVRNADGVAAYDVNGEIFYVTANEGDARDDEVSRVADLDLDPDAFPDAATLQLEENLGRLEVLNTRGDTDGDGDFDELFAIGARSFSIFDADGNLVFDSGNDFEQITAALVPDQFNSNGTADSFDSRSDDGGPEPEGVTVGQVGDSTYAFIGLERVGGVMVYDITEPEDAFFVTYVDNANPFDTDAPFLGPEGLQFISADDSPNGNALLAVGNEVSGSTAIYEISEQETFTLQILHASDLEGGVDAIANAPNFATIVDRLEDEVPNSVLLSAGDNIIPGPFFNAAGDREAFRDSDLFNDIYNTLFGTDAYDSLREGGGRVDITIMNILGFDASAVGNHEFDAGSDAFEQIIEEDFRSNAEDGSPDGPTGDRWVGAQFPYLSANLDFSGDGDLGNLFTDQILPSTDFATGPDQSAAGESSVPKLAQATTIEEGGELIGVVGATTQLIENISSPSGTTETTGGVNDMQALADALNPVIEDLMDGDDNVMGTEDDVNKIILVSHLQQFALEQELAGLLNGVDVIIAGGSDTLSADEQDRLRAGDTADVDYPFLTTNADGDPTAIMSTAGEYSYVGRLVVEFDEDGVLIPGSIDEDVSGAFATDDQGVIDVTGAATAEEAVAGSAKGTEVQTLVDAVSEVVTAQDGNVFGETDVFLDGRRESVRTEETNLGNLTADANLAEARKVDETVQVSIKNGGGIRALIGEVDSTDGTELPPQANPLSGKEDGQVSQLDIDNALRFNNALTLITLTPAQLLEVLEHAVAETAPGATPGQFAQVGGLNFSFDPDLAAGSRVQNVALVDDDGAFVEALVVDGEVVSDTPVRVVTLDFLANGNDGYPFADFVAADPEFADRVDLIGEDENGNGVLDDGEDLNLNGELDGPALTDPGVATFADPGTEQDALAEFLAAEHPVGGDTPFGDAETDPEDDQRIQNLAVEGATDTVIPPTIAGLVAASGDDFDDNPDDFDILLAAVTAADLVGALDAEDADLTVVAPTDAAFIELARAFGFDGEDESGAFDAIVAVLAEFADDDDPIGPLTDILLYHVFPSSQTVAALQDAGTVDTLLADATVDVDGDTVVDNEPDLDDPQFVSGATDIVASNGIVHAIDGVLIPDDAIFVPTITDLVQQSGDDFDDNPADFDLLLAALEAADLAGALDDRDADFTVVAPVDAAFVGLAQAFGYIGDDEEVAFDVIVEGLTELAPDDPIGLLTDILLYHVFPSSQTVAELQAAGPVQTLLTDATLQVDGNALVDADPDVADPRFVEGATDIETANGLVHGIDGVVLPADIELPDVFDAVPIYQIQGAGHVSTFDGELVETRGIVTAVDSNGFYLQDADGDGDDATSDGIFVFTGSAPMVAVGDDVDVQGRVSEFIPGGADTGNLSITQITDAAVSVVSSDNDLPAAMVIGQGGRVPPAEIVISDDELPTSLTDPATANLNFDPDEDGIDFYESVEGMLVTVEDPQAVSGTNRFNETWVVANNGADVEPADALNDRGGIEIQADADGFGDLNPERVQIQYDSTITPDAAEVDITTGDDLGDVTGVVSYSFGNYEVLVTETFDVTDGGTAPETTTLAPAEGELTIASYNVLNLSAAESDDEQREVLAEHIVTNLAAPDIIALQEIQDNSGDDDDGGEGDGVLDADETLQALVDAIAAAGGPTYEFASAEVDEDGETGGAPGGNIRNAYLWNPDRVTLDEADGVETLETEELVALGALEADEANPFNEANARDPLLATFEFEGREVKVINNHFESRSGSDPIFGANQPFEQAGEQSREDSAQVINDVVDALIAEDPDVKVAVVGDLNTFEFTDDVAEILPGTGDERVLTNLIDDPSLDGARYTFNFQGNSQVLDHILISDTLLDGSDVDIVHLNTDFPNGTDGVGSDHEPVLAKVEIEEAPDELTVVFEFSQANRDHALGWYNIDTGEAEVLFQSTKALRGGESLSTPDNLVELEDRTAVIDLSDQSFDDLEFFLIVAEGPDPEDDDPLAGVLTEDSVVSVDRTDGAGMVMVDDTGFDAFFTEADLNRDGLNHAFALEGEDRAVDSIDPQDATLDNVRADGPVGLLAWEDLLFLGDSDFEDAVFTISATDTMV